ncbi:ankyrin [Stipitochalara longipes BDJ]|nr:ankyrin [Stipitochalara longipes BDJ]
MGPDKELLARRRFGDKLKGLFHRKDKLVEASDLRGQTITASSPPPTVRSRNTTTSSHESASKAKGFASASPPEIKATPALKSSQIIPSAISPVESEPSTDIKPRTSGNIGSTTKEARFSALGRGQKPTSNSEDWKEFEKVRLKDAFNFGDVEAENVITVDAVMNDLKTAKNRFKKDQWVITLGQKRIVCHDIIDKIVGYAETFGEIGTALTALDPTQHAGMAWGGVQFFIKAASNNQVIREVALDQEIIAHLIVRYAIFEKLYIEDRPLSQTQPELRLALVELYTRVLKYQAHALKYLGGSKYAHAKHSFTPPADHPVKKALVEISDQQHVIDSFQVLDDKEFQAKFKKELESRLQSLKQPLDRIDLEIKYVRDNLDVTKRRDILNWISSGEYEQHHMEIKRKILNGTGVWLLQHTLFQDWRRSRASSMFWLHGIVGCGKSTLVSFIVQHLLDKSAPSNRERVAYFYCNKTSRPNDLNEAETCLRSVVMQLAQFNGGELLERVTDLWKNKPSGRLTAEECTSLITELAEHSPQTTIIIDALDEYETTELRTSLLDYLFTVIGDAKRPVKIFISSRNLQDIKIEMQHPAVVEVEVRAAYNKHDIQDYVQTSLGKYLKSSRLLGGLESAGRGGLVKEDFQHEIEQHLTDNAQGMFKWAQLSLQSLTTCETVKDARQRLYNLPHELNALYADLYESIEGHECVKRLLKWLMFGDPDLSADALMTAISLDLEGTGSQEKVSRFKLLEFCHNLVEEDVEQDRFRLAHLSVKEFLESYLVPPKADAKPQGPPVHPYTPTLCHSLIAQTCVAYFCCEIIEPNAHLQQNGFHNYAVLQWPQHFGKASEVETATSVLEIQAQESLRSILNTFIANSQDRCPLDQWMRNIRASLYPLHYTGLQWQLEGCISNPPIVFFTACAFELYNLLNDLVAADSEIVRARNEKGQTGLHLAFYNRSYKAAKLLLQRGADVDAVCHKGRSTIDVLLKTGDTNMLKILLEYNITIDMDSAVRTIFEASRGNSARMIYNTAEKTFRFLLDNYACSFSTETLEYVSKAADGQIVRLVLESSQDVEVDLEVLSAAAQNGYCNGDAFELLLARYSGGTIPASVLETAILRGNIGHVRALTSWHGDITLSATAIENIAWSKYYSANDITAIVEMLLKKFDTLPITDEIINAAQHGNNESTKLVHLLLTQPGDIQIPTDTAEDIASIYTGEILQFLLSRLGDDQKTPTLLQSAFLNSSLAVQKTMLEEKVIEITENILEGMADESNDDVWEMVLEHLGDITVTEQQLLKAADRGRLKVFELLLERPRNFPISEEILRATVNPSSRCFKDRNVAYKKTTLLISQPDKVPVTEGVVIAAAAEGPDMLRLLIEIYKEIPITDEVLKTVIRRTRSHKHHGECVELLEIMFSVKPTPKVSACIFQEAAQRRSADAMGFFLNLEQDFEITTEVMIMAARSQCPYNSVWARLLEESRDLPLTEEVVVAFMAHADSESTALLLDRPENIQITDNIFKAAAKRHNTDVTRLLLQKQPNLENPEDVLATVAEFGTSALLRLYLEHIRDVNVSEAVIIGAARNEFGREKLVQLTPWIKDLKITEKIRNAALGNPTWPRRCEETMLYILQLRQKDSPLSDSEENLLESLKQYEP